MRFIMMGLVLSLTLGVAAVPLNTRPNDMQYPDPAEKEIHIVESIKVADNLDKAHEWIWPKKKGAGAEPGSSANSLHSSA